MGTYADFIKPIVYHDILSPRTRHWVLNRWRQSIFQEISESQTLDLFYDLYGYDKSLEPVLDDLEKTGFSSDYVYRATKHCVDSVAGRANVYPGISFDVPWNAEHFSSDPERVYEAVLKAFEAGADGIVISREYDEMRVKNLDAVGRAMKELM